MSNPILNLADLLTVRQTATLCPGLTEGALRALIFNAERNGLAPCLIRRGGRVFIDRARFEKWWEDGRQAEARP